MSGVSQFLSHYLNLLDRFWTTQDGQKLANLLSLRHEHASNTAHQKPESMVAKFVQNPLDELVCFHLKCLHAISQGNYEDAYQHQSAMVQVLIKIIQAQKEENWFLPVMYAVCLDLRLLAQKVEREREGHPLGKPGEILEKAAESLMGCFRVCAADNRSSEEDTKRLGMLNLVNQLFKVYFKINKLHLCKPLIRAVESSPFKDSFSLSQQITYKYYVGRQAMFDCEYKTADEYLTYAFENCHRNSLRNKRLILIYLVPVKMLLGYIPSKTVLEKYDVLQFWDLVQAVCKGDLKTFDQLLEIHEEFFIKSGIYLLVEKLKIIAYRNLFRKVYLILNTHQIPVDALQTALVYLGQEDVDLNETQCIVANLIFEGKIKGYISHQHMKIVVSKQNPFPPLTSLI